MSRDEFLPDEKTQAAVLSLPDSVKRGYPEVPWKQMTATRDFLAQGYYRVESDVIWDIAEKDLPKLKEQIRGIQADMSGGGGGEV